MMNTWTANIIGEGFDLANWTTAIMKYKDSIIA